MCRAAAAAAMFVVLAVAPVRAVAGPTIVTGGPTAQRAKVDAALSQAAAAMAVCWRAAPPPTVVVKVVVSAAGAVMAVPMTRVPAAQCAAGVLAVWTLPGGSWSGEIEFTSIVAPADLGSAIQQQLLAHSDSIRACQSVNPAGVGQVGIKMAIQPDGSIRDVVVKSALGAKLDTCVQRAMTTVQIDPIGGTLPLKYQLTVAFSGKASPAAASPGGGGQAPTGGNVSGALAADQVSAVLDRARPTLLACRKGSERKGTVVTRFTVRPDGTAKNVVVKEPIGDPAIEACLVGVFKALEFAKAPDETKVTYPVAFN